MRFPTKYGRISLSFSIFLLLCFSLVITPAEITIQRSMDANSILEPLLDEESQRPLLTEIDLQENWAGSGEHSSISFRGINSPSMLEWTWTDLGQVLADAYHPEILQLVNGSYVMAYNGDKYSSVNISLSNDLLNWGPSIEITSAHNPWMHSMVQLPNGSVLLAYADDAGWDIYTTISNDLISWSTPSLALSDAGRLPSMILDDSGELHIVMINDDGSHHTPFISSSADYGATWDSATPLLSTPSDEDYAVGLLQLQNQSYAIIFGSDRSGSRRFYLTLSDDFQTWSDPFELPLNICDGCYYHAVHQLCDGQIIFFYGAATGGIYSVQTADFLTWTPPLLVTPTSASGPVLQSDSRRIIELANGSLRFFPATIIDSDHPTGIRCFGYDPPYEGWQGDQIISNETIIEDREIVLNGSLVIASQGNLTLRNATLAIACSFPGEHFIVVESGGFLAVEAQSTILPTNPCNAWCLKAKKGSALRLLDSSFSHAGWDWGLHGNQSGLWINTPNAEVVNCSIDNNFIGLYFFDAEGGLIANNTIMNTSYYGCFLNASARSTISNNKMMYTDGPAIGLIHSWDSSINDNTIVNSSGYGISLENSINCHIASNSLDYPGSQGVFLNNSANSQIVNNVVNYGGEGGISIQYSSTNCTVSGNSITWALVGITISTSSVDCSVANNTIDWTYAGIAILDFANRTLVSGNFILTSFAYSGIYISNASAATISNNVIYNSTPYGIFLQSFSDNNLIEWNDFLNNSASGNSQAYDSCTNNTFRYNHWSNWTSPDDNSDGIVDSPYVIDGGVSNADPSPLVAPYNGPVRLRATIVFPSGGATVRGIANIQWTAPINLPGFDITYGVYYSPDNGSTWTLLASGLTNTIYPWNVTDLDDGSKYLIRIEIIDSYGFMANITSDLFTIFNSRTILVTLIYPNGGEVLNGSVDISWSVNDTSTALTYRIQYSWDGGESWDNLTTFGSNSTPVTWSWDTTQHQDSWFYLIRVIVVTAKAVGNDTSDSIFSIDNDPVIVFEGLEITGPDNVFQISSTITVSIDVATSVNVTVKQLSPENVPPASSDLDVLEVFLDISLSDAAALVVLWINVSFAELPEDQDPSKVRLYFYNETSENWELVKQTGVDYENEVVWGWTDHVTTFGLMVAQPEELVEENPLGLLLLLTAAAVLVISAVAFVLYRRVKELEKGEERRKRERWL